jgi:class 3 adenylate cyclase
MARLSTSDRAKLPDSAFAYIDSRGKRLLPIHDAGHVRNALARFDQVRFESEAARARARERLLNAAKRHGIVPIGFITGQLRTDRRHAAAGRVVIELAGVRSSEDLERQLRKALGDPSLAVLRWWEAGDCYVDGAGRPAPLPAETRSRAITTLASPTGPGTALVHSRAVLADPDIAEAVLAAVRLVVERQRIDLVEAPPTDWTPLPAGVVTHLLTDIEDSTSLLTRLGERYTGVLSQVRAIIRRAVAQTGGHEVEARADEFYAVFERAAAGLAAAVALQRGLQAGEWPDGLDVRVRAGVHTGEIALTDAGYVGLSVHTAARVSAAAHGGQILTTSATVAAAGEVPDVRYRSLGRQRLAGLPEPEELFQVEADGLAKEFPPPRTGARPAAATR